MSCEYTRVLPDALPLKVYGFRKVSRTELEGIVGRLQRRTHCTETQLSAGEQWAATDGAPPRPPFAPCGRRSACSPPAPPTPPGRAPVGGRALQKIVRRLQRPTISTMAAEGSLAPQYELDMAARTPANGAWTGTGSRRPRTADEQTKLLERIQRPTTASRRKLFGHTTCLLCQELHRSSVHQTMRHMLSNECASHSRRPTSTTSTAGAAVAAPADDGGCGGGVGGVGGGDNSTRARSPTHASLGGQSPCPRMSSSKVRIMSPGSRPESRSLISGLARSEKVDDITERLYPLPPASPRGSRPVSCLRRSPLIPATPVSVNA